MPLFRKHLNYIHTSSRFQQHGVVQGKICCINCVFHSMGYDGPLASFNPINVFVNFSAIIT